MSPERETGESGQTDKWTLKTTSQTQRSWLTLPERALVKVTPTKRQGDRCRGSEPHGGAFTLGLPVKQGASSPEVPWSLLHSVLVDLNKDIGNQNKSHQKLSQPMTSLRPHPTPTPPHPHSGFNPAGPSGENPPGECSLLGALFWGWGETGLSGAS